MRVFIAEKPSLAQAIFEGLGGNPSTEKQQGYFQHGSDIVTWCYGHMLELFDPQDYDPKYEQWRLEDLPIPATFPPTLKPKPESKAQFNTLLTLIGKADSIVHAGDPDDEGQLLVDEILNYTANTKPVQRLLVADLNLAPVQKALANMPPNDRFIPAGMSALARSVGDQNFGYNLTRACTLKGRERGFQGVLNVGRVQSAVLGLVNGRTLANQNHRESFYYDVQGDFSVGGQVFRAKYVTTDNDQTDEKKRLLSASQAQFIAEKVRNQPGLVTLAMTRPEKKQAPQPLNLSTLQQLCAKSWGFSAEKTLKLTQSLYETHKLVTYPRTDNRFLSDEHFYQSKDVLAAVVATAPGLDGAIQQADTQQKHKAFNAEKIEAHHAIIPTTKPGDPATLSADERQVYELIASYFIGLFYPESIRDKTKVMVDIEDFQFSATQSVLVQQGWEALHRAEKNTDERQQGVDLSSLNMNSPAECCGAEVEKKKTNPPKYFTESTLLAAMTRAASFIDDPDLRKTLEAKDKDSQAESGSIGTEATRAGILGKLAQNTNLVSIESEKGYKEKVWKTTLQGQEFCAVLPKEIIAPDISAIWAGEQAKIKAGELSVEAFIQSLDTYIAEQVASIDSNGIDITSNAPACPKCQTGFLRKRKGQKGYFWGCNRYPDCEATFPDRNGKPNFEKRKPVKVSDHACPNCGKGLIRRPGKRYKGKPSYFWGCSGFPGCKTTAFDKAGKPDFSTAK